jgi:hypothetical protein
VVIAILIITQFTSECKSLNNKLHRRLKESLSNTSLIKIISMTSLSLTFKSVCDTNLYDELNNIYQITGPFQLVCGEEREFSYTDSVKVWHTDKCCYKTSVPDEWNILESEEMVTKGKDFSEKGKYGPCRNFCSSRYKYRSIKKNYNYTVRKKYLW